MKLRITVEGKSYDVEVEHVEGSDLPSAALRVESAPAGSAGALPARGAGQNGNGKGVKPAAPSAPNSQPSPQPKAAAATPTITTPSIKPAAARREPAEIIPPLPPRPAHEPWHATSVGGPGESVAPIPGIVSSIHVNVGDSVKLNDPIATLEAAHSFQTGARAMTGTVRSLHAGIVLELLVKSGDIVGFGQVLARVQTREG